LKRGIVKTSPPKNPFAEARTARQEGVGGRNAEPSERSPQSPAACSSRAEHQRKVLFSFYLPAEASAQAGKKKSGARKIRNANKTFLWCGER